MIWWIIAAACANFIKGLCGFANTLVFTSVMSFSADNAAITPVEICLSYPANIIVVIKERKNIKPRIVIPLSILVLIGCIPGVFLLKNAGAEIVKVILGAVIIIIGVELLIENLAKNRSEKKTSKVLLVIIGLFSGVMCGMYGIGAQLGAYIGRVTDSASEFKANICTVFFIEGTFRIILYAVSGLFILETLKYALILAPVAILFLFIGLATGKRLSDRVSKIVVIIMLIISGVFLIATNIGSVINVH